MLETEREALSKTFVSLLYDENSFRFELKDVALFLWGSLDQQEEELGVVLTRLKKLQSSMYDHRDA